MDEKMKKLLKFVILPLLVIIIIVAVVFSFYMESIVKKAVNKYGSEIVGTEVNLGSFALSVFDGHLRLENLTVANPKNYSKPNIMSLGLVDVKLNIKSLFSDKIIVENIIIEDPKITYEMISLTQNNVSQLLENINHYTTKGTKADTKKDETTKEAASNTKASGKKLMIDLVRVTGGQVEAAASVAGKEAYTSANIPDIEIRDIGRDKGDLRKDITSAVSLIFKKILNESYQAVVQGKMVDLKGVAKEGLNSIVNDVKEKSGVKGWFGLDKKKETN